MQPGTSEVRHHKEASSLSAGPLSVERYSQCKQTQVRRMHDANTERLPCTACDGTPSWARHHTLPGSLALPNSWSANCCRLWPRHSSTPCSRYCAKTWCAGSGICRPQRTS